MDTNGTRKESDSYAVLLYYTYAFIPDVATLAGFYDKHCRSLGLVGRIRIGADGVNATIGGKLSALEEHIAAMKKDSLFNGTDFKLAPCCCPTNEKIAKECGFNSLSVRVVKELVTFRSDSMLKSPKILNAGRHLSAAEFHHVLQEAGNAPKCGGTRKKEDVILLDVRNLYETRIGMFKVENVDSLDPKIRQYSDLAAWMDDHSERLRNKKVLMYCTGGIRCEMASAYIISKGVDFENVFQLFGGILRYLEHFPHGGYFKGKNFVFDHRISIGSVDVDVLGTCLICGSPFDDYSSRCRCANCRMLVLVCYSCQGKHEKYACELCQKYEVGKNKIPVLQNNSLILDVSPSSRAAVQVESETMNNIINPRCELFRRCVPNYTRKLRILCLHGFRQNASNFKGRTSALAKKLRDIVEFTFIDAPHRLPSTYQPTDSCFEQGSPPQMAECKRRFAWLVSPTSVSSDEQRWEIKQQFDPLQFQMQTEGYEESYLCLQNVIQRMGPFDGILGFSQGAAMAALFFEHQQRNGCSSDFQFAVLCSGFIPSTVKSDKLCIKCPSLHVFGGGRGKDRQINTEASRELAELFDGNISVTIEHDMGHIIPTRPPYIGQIRSFLMGFL